MARSPDYGITSDTLLLSPLPSSHVASSTLLYETSNAQHTRCAIIVSLILPSSSLPGQSDFAWLREPPHPPHFPGLLCPATLHAA